MKARSESTVASHHQLAGWIRNDIRGTASPKTLGNLCPMQRRAAHLQMLITSLLSYARFGYTETLIEVVILEEFVGDIAALIAPGFLIQLSGEISILRTQRFPREWLAAEFRVEDDGWAFPSNFRKRVLPNFKH
jgi:hypothetical protein